MSFPEMKAKHWHRLFLYGVTLILLIGYLMTKDPLLWNGFIHMIGPMAAYEIGTAVGAASVAQPKV